MVTRRDLRVVPDERRQVEERQVKREGAAIEAGRMWVRHAKRALLRDLAEEYLREPHKVLTVLTARQVAADLLLRAEELKDDSEEAV